MGFAERHRKAQMLTSDLLTKYGHSYTHLLNKLVLGRLERVNQTPSSNRGIAF